MKKLLLLLLLTLVAGARPGWREFAPQGESFQCEFPTTSKISDSKTTDSSYWLALEKGGAHLFRQRHYLQRRPPDHRRAFPDNL